MKRLNAITVVTLLTLFLALSACKKKDVNTDAAPASPPDVTAPAYSFSRFDANGLLKVKLSFAYWDNPLTGLQETISKEASAYFKISPFDSLFADAGAVSCVNSFLTKQSNLGYVANGSGANGISFNDTIGTDWNVAGLPATSMPAFLFRTAKPMPKYYGVGNNSIPSTISRSTGVTIPLGANLSNADSVFVSLTVGQKFIRKTIGGLSPSCDFSNTELSVLSSSGGTNALLQIVPVNYDVSLQSGKKMYFANETAYSKFVEVK